MCVSLSLSRSLFLSFSTFLSRVRSFDHFWLAKSICNRWVFLLRFVVVGKRVFWILSGGFLVGYWGLCCCCWVGEGGGWEEAAAMAMVMTEKEEARVEKGPESLEEAIKLIEEFRLPGGLLPLENVVECGYIKETGYVWITQKKAIQHTFKKISKQVSYGENITAYLEKGRLKKLTGVKAKELLLWVSIVDISLENPDAEPSEKEEDAKIHFKSFAGIGKTFPVNAFARGEWVFWMLLPTYSGVFLSSRDVTSAVSFVAILATTITFYFIFSSGSWAHGKWSAVVTFPSHFNAWNSWQ